MRILISISILLFFAASTYGAGDAQAGKAQYDKSCKSCHGATGAPNESVAKMFKVEIKDLGSAEVQSASDDEMKKIITAGKGKMPAAKNLSAKAVDDVIAYVRTLKK